MGWRTWAPNGQAPALLPLCSVSAWQTELGSPRAAVSLGNAVVKDVPLHIISASLTRLGQLPVADRERFVKHL